MPALWTYLWDFGDGTTSTSSAVTSHTYPTYGKLYITLHRNNSVCVQTQRSRSSSSRFLPSLILPMHLHRVVQPLTWQFTTLSQFADRYLSMGFWWWVTSSDQPSYTYFNPGTYRSLNSSNIRTEITKLRRRSLSYPSRLQTLRSHPRWF